MDEYASRGERQQERREQAEAAQSDDEIEPAMIPGGRFVHRAGFRKARISSPRRM